MNEVLHQIGHLGVVPILAIDCADDAVPLAQALMEGGLPCAEVTFRTAAAEEAMKRIAKSFPALLLGAGTVLTVDQVKAAVDAGATFIVSPGTSTTVVQYCVEHAITVVPGVATPTEVQTALELGVDIVKFFPAEANGGVAYLKALSGPFKHVRFIPTGGVDESNMLSYLALPNVLAVGGSWMVRSELIAAKRFDEICRLTAQAVQKASGRQARERAGSISEVPSNAKQ